MKAIRIDAPGGADVLRVAELPVPEPGPHDVLVRNVAVGVGMPDILVRRGVYAWMPALPAVIGIESAGIVHRVGSQVTQVAPGDAVYVNARDLAERSGGYAEYRLAPAAAVHALPPGVDLRKAAALGNYQVAECLLRMGASFPPPARVAVYGAAGGVGSAAVQLARARGWHVVAIAGSAEKCEFARRQGAHHAIDHRAGNVVEAIRACTGGAGVDLLLDIASGEGLPALFGALAPFGTVVSYGFTAGEPPGTTVPAMRRLFGRSPAWRLFSMHSLDASPQLRRELTQTLIDALAAGTIDPCVHAEFPLEAAEAAHRLFERKAAFGKLLLIP